MSWRSLLGLVLLMAAVLSGWSAWRNRASAPDTPVEQLRSDYTLTDFEIVALDEHGKEATTLRAPTMERSRADESITIQQPLFLLPDDEGKHWQLRANTGWLSAKGDEMRLQDDVSGDSPEGTTPSTFRTNTLNVFPRQNQARTADKVTMTRPGLVQTGTGFQVDLKTKQYSLLSQVKTRYEPKAAR